MTLKVPVLQLDPGAAVVFGDEPDLHLTRASGVRLEVPGGPDVPGEHDAAGRLIDQHPRPLASAAIGTDVVDLAAYPWLEDGLGYRNREQVVFTRFDRIESLDEHAESPFHRRIDDDALRRTLKIGRGAGNGAQAVVILTRVAGEQVVLVVEPDGPAPQE